MQIKTKLANVVTKFISQPIKQKLTIIMTLLLSMTLLQLLGHLQQEKEKMLNLMLASKNTFIIGQKI